jgi:hypothetical protein
VPGKLGRLDTHIYVVDGETSLPVEVRHTSCIYLPWEPCNQGRQGTYICVVAIEALPRRQARHSFAKLL